MVFNIRTLKLQKFPKILRKINEFLRKMESKKHFFSFRLTFTFLCHSNIVVEMYQIPIEAKEGKKSFISGFSRVCQFA